MRLETIAALRNLGISPELVDALVEQGRLSPEPGSGYFDIPHVGFEDEPEPHHRWDPTRAYPDAWTDPNAPGLWLPFGVARDGLVCVGASTGLALGSLLFGVSAADGSIKRKGRLPHSLAELAPVVLPEDHPDVSLEWLAESFFGGALFDWLKDRGFEQLYLAINRRPVGAEFATPAIDRLIWEVISEARRADLPVILVPMEGRPTLRDFWLPFEGYGRAYALAGVLEYAALLAQQFLINLDNLEKEGSK